MNIIRTIGTGAVFIAISATAFVGWCWLLYVSPLGPWWRREYLNLTLVAFVVGALVPTFVRHRHLNQEPAWLATVATLAVCAIIAIVVAVVATAVQPWALPLK